MTREEAKDLLPIIQAWAEGKNIQFLSDGEWHDINQADFTCYPDKYRIKPEPTYRPFENAQECLEEMKRHEPFGWVKYKPGFGDRCLAITEVYISSIRIGVTWFCTEEMFQYSTFLDGSPFGVKVEDEEE